MNNKGFAAIILTILLAIVLGVWWYTSSRNIAEPVVVVTNTPAADPRADWRLFINREYGFQVKYPPGYVAIAGLTNTMRKEIVKFEYTDPLKAPTPPDSITIRLVPWTKDTDFRKVLIDDVVFDGSGEHPEDFSEFTERTIGNYTYYSILTGRFEGVLSFAYYVVSEKYGIYAFDAVAHGVDWTNPNLNEEEDSVHKALKSMLETFLFTQKQSTATTTSAI